MGHLSYDKVILIRQSFVDMQSKKDYICCAYHYAKQKRLCFALNCSLTSKRFGALHLNTLGHCNITYFQGYKYFITIVGHNSRFTHINLLTTKSKTKHNIKNFVDVTEIQLETNFKILCTDNEVELCMNDFYASKGIIYQRSYVETKKMTLLKENPSIYCLLLMPSFSKVI